MLTQQPWDDIDGLEEIQGCLVAGTIEGAMVVTRSCLVAAKIARERRDEVEQARRRVRWWEWIVVPLACSLATPFWYICMKNDPDFPNPYLLAFVGFGYFAGWCAVRGLASYVTLPWPGKLVTVWAIGSALEFAGGLFYLLALGWVWFLKRSLGA